MVDDLGNPNIVRLVMSLRIGDKMNIVFPCAMTNLDCCLREEKYHLDQICHHPIRYGVIWEQMTGISDALHKILTTVREHPDAKEPLIGYHFDLKPANILVYENKPLCKSTSKDYTFKITDFGLSWFKNAESGSNTQPFIGDPRYMPPEARSGKSRRKYDVWSLGCILLEVTAFAVKSYKGVADLDEILKTASSNDQGGYTGFFSRNGSDGRAILRPEIRIFMDHDLVSALRTDEERDVSFVGKMVDLIKQMLEPNPDNRIGSEAVVEKLRSLRNEMAQDANKIVQPAAKRKDEKEIGEVELRSLE
jgi:serine/threonine protein kinase